MAVLPGATTGRPLVMDEMFPVVPVFGLLLFQDFDTLSHLFDHLKGVFESLLQGVALLFEQLHLLLFDGSSLS